MNVCGFLPAPVTNHVDRVAGFAFFEMMVACEQIPVRPLVGHDYACAFAQRTDAVEGSDHGGSDKLGPIGNPFHGISQRFRDLERDDVQLFLFHGHVPSKTRTVFETVIITL